MEEKMDKNFEAIFNSYDRITKDDVIKKIIIFVQKNIMYILILKI